MNEPWRDWKQHFICMYVKWMKIRSLLSVFISPDLTSWFVSREREKVVISYCWSEKIQISIITIFIIDQVSSSSVCVCVCVLWHQQ